MFRFGGESVIFWPYVYNNLLKWKYNREIVKAKKETEEIALGFWELYNFATTFHGRFQLIKVVNAVDNEEVDIDPNVVSLYRYVLLVAPYQIYAIYN